MIRRWWRRWRYGPCRRCGMPGPRHRSVVECAITAEWLRRAQWNARHGVTSSLIGEQGPGLVVLPEDTVIGGQA